MILRLLLMLLVVIIACSECQADASASISSTGHPPPPLPSRPPSPSLLEAWTEARTAGDRRTFSPTKEKRPPASDYSAVWLYSGTLHDVTTGQSIAAVDGIELVRPLSGAHIGGTAKEMEEEDEGKEGKCSRREEEYDVQCRRDLAGLLSSKDADLHATTILSRKMFCYRPSVEDDESVSSGSFDPNRLLREIRLRPGSSKGRRIPVDQAVNVYDTATTYVAAVPAAPSRQQQQQQQEKWLVHSEWPDGRAVWTFADVQSTMGTNTASPLLSSTSHSREVDRDGDTERQRGRGGKLLFLKGWRKDKQSVSAPSKRRTETTVEMGLQIRQAPSRRPMPSSLVDGLPETLLARGVGSGSGPTVSPARSSLVQFGPSRAEQRGLGLGGAVRERYQYTLDDDDDDNDGKGCRVRYTRYGEGPVWYGPGRRCCLELTGRRVEDPKRLLSRIADKNDPTGTADADAEVPVAVLAVRLARRIPGFWDGFNTTPASSSSSSSFKKAAMEETPRRLPLSSSSDNAVGMCPSNARVGAFRRQGRSREREEFPPLLLQRLLDEAASEGDNGELLQLLGADRQDLRYTLGDGMSNCWPLSFRRKAVNAWKRLRGATSHSAALSGDNFNDVSQGDGTGY